MGLVACPVGNKGHTIKIRQPTWQFPHVLNHVATAITPPPPLLQAPSCFVTAKHTLYTPIHSVLSWVHRSVISEKSALNRPTTTHIREISCFLSSSLEGLDNPMTILCSLQYLSLAYPTAECKLPAKASHP